MEANPFLKINQFISPFWTERQWFFEIIVDDDDMTISIHSHKKRWFNKYEYEQGNTGTCLNQSMECSIISKQENIYKSSTKLDRTIQSNLNLILSQVDQIFIEEFNAVCDAIHFTHLNIECDEISNEILLNIVQLLPNLESLKVSSKRINEIDRSFTIVKSMYFLTSTNNKITKVYLAKTIYLTQVNFLLNLCLSMQHFQVDVPEDMNLDRLVQFILFKVTTIIAKLRSLCLCIPKAGEHTICQIRNRIESKNLLSNCRIMRSGENILVTWI
ncbi:hypothetical protein I4U23_015781 [Adineta vaga]|nr:hypothetical protein I4U23_015781 [Adineta vaga]